MVSRAFSSLLAVAFAAALAAGASAAAGDGAEIVDSGSTNALGYRIDIRSGGAASVTLQGRGGVAAGSAKAFSVPSAQTSRFFADLKAARDGKAAGTPCMKSASFGTTTHVSWHGWTSPDLDCPPANALEAALVHDVGVIRAASGVDTMPLHRGLLPGPRRLPVVMPSTAPVSPNPSPT